MNGIEQGIATAAGSISTVGVLYLIIVKLIEGKRNNKNGTSPQAQKELHDSVAHAHSRLDETLKDCAERHSNLQRELGGYGQRFTNIEESLKQQNNKLDSLLEIGYPDGKVDRHR